jgi:CubicO group peptidase (beta-lactamase class C family)
MRDLSSFLEGHRKKLGFPALAAAVVSSNRIAGAAAIGERKTDSGVPVTLQDRFHFGSITKSITALLAVELERRDQIEFGSTAGEILDWKLSSEQKSITLEMLLRNRSGLGGTPSAELWSEAWSLKGPPAAQRAVFLRDYLEETPLEAKPGTKYIYSNIGFSLAGAMLEKKTGIPWEQLVVTNIFRPLHLDSAGFGAPASPGRTNEPWGHQFRAGTLTAIEPSDNPPAIAPAAAVHVSVLDAARYAAFHLANARGEVKVLRPYVKEMYTPPAGSDYALGWIVQKRSWAHGEVLFHAGSNTMFYTIIWIAPARDFAVVVMTNVGDPKPERIGEKCDQVVAALISEFLQ